MHPPNDPWPAARVAPRTVRGYPAETLQAVIDPDFLALLACPLCESRPPLRQQGEFLVCYACGHGYRIVAGIPELLPEDAIPPAKLKELLDGR